MELTGDETDEEKAQAVKDSVAAMAATTNITGMASQTKAWWGEDGAAYRFNVSNGARAMFESELQIGTKGTKYWVDSEDSSIKYGRLTPQGTSVSYEVVPGTDDVEDYENIVRGFQTKNIMISKALRESSDIKEVEITYFQKIDPTVSTNLPLWKGVDSATNPLTYDPTKVPALPTNQPYLARKTVSYDYLLGLVDSDGNAGAAMDPDKMTKAYLDNDSLVIPWEEWGEGYITNVVVRFNRVDPSTGLAADGTTKTHDAFVDVWGEANNVRDMPLSAWFGCTYDHQGWHYDRDEPAPTAPTRAATPGAAGPTCGPGTPVTLRPTVLATPAWATGCSS